MESTDKNYWLYLEPDVFIFQEKKKTILYNSLSKKIIDVEYSAEVNSLIQQFLNPNNVYVITLTSSELLNQSIDNFVNVIREAYFGDIIQQRDNNKPVIIPPILKIHKNREFLKRDHEIALGENIISKLEEITLHLNGECYQNCEFCGKINQQFNFCCKNNGELGIESIKNLFSRLQYSRSRVIFTGGNVFKYSNYYTLLDLLKRYGFKTIFCFHYLNFEPNMAYDLIDGIDVNLSIYITFPLDTAQLKKTLRITKEFSHISNYIFVVQNETDLIEVQKIIDDNNINDNSSINPFYDNDNNHLFFEQNVLIEETDIYDTLPNRQEIFARQSFNTYDFGKLIVSCKGEIYANVNHSPIGCITENIAETVLKEFAEGQSWFRVRDMEPCNNCIYQWLCPSPSNYEIIIGKPNLCHIKQ